MALYCAVDLHSNNGVWAIVDDCNEVVMRRRIPNQLPEILRRLEPHRQEIKTIVIESTYNWYWMADGLMERGYRVQLANPSAIHQYEGLKHGNDGTDALHLARLVRLGILPEGHIYPKEVRPIRDLLRRRMTLVQQRTSHILSLQAMVARELGCQMPSNEVKALDEGDLRKLFTHPAHILAGTVNLKMVETLNEQIVFIEKHIEADLEDSTLLMLLRTIPGVGRTLGLTILLETGDIGRFPDAGHYASYCRLVESTRISNGKQKGRGNRKSGNQYLCWAYIEAANHCRRSCAAAEKFHQRKRSKKENVVAICAMACKLSKAAFFIMRDGVPFDEKKIFP